MVKVLSKDQALNLRNSFVAQMTALKAQLDSLENSLEAAENKKNEANVSASRIRSAIAKIRKQMLKVRRSTKRIDRLLSKGSMRSNDETIYVQWNLLLKKYEIMEKLSNGSYGRVDGTDKKYC